MVCWIHSSAPCARLLFPWTTISRFRQIRSPAPAVTLRRLSDLRSLRGKEDEVCCVREWFCTEKSTRKASSLALSSSATCEALAAGVKRRARWTCSSLLVPVLPFQASSVLSRRCRKLSTTGRTPLCATARGRLSVQCTSTTSLQPSRMNGRGYLMYGQRGMYSTSLRWSQTSSCTRQCHRRRGNRHRGRQRSQRRFCHQRRRPCHPVGSASLLPRRRQPRRRSGRQTRLLHLCYHRHRGPRPLAPRTQCTVLCGRRRLRLRGRFVGSAVGVYSVSLWCKTAEDWVQDREDCGARPCHVASSHNTSVHIIPYHVTS